MNLGWNPLFVFQNSFSQPKDKDEIFTLYSGIITRFVLSVWRCGSTA